MEEIHVLPLRKGPCIHGESFHFHNDFLIIKALVQVAPFLSMQYQLDPINYFSVQLKANASCLQPNLLCSSSIGFLNTAIQNRFTVVL